jgi:hypothetical protein
MESAAEYLRDMAEAMADGPLESAVSTIMRLEQIADDLDALLGTAVPKQGSGEVFEAVQRLRKGGVA